MAKREHLSALFILGFCVLHSVDVQSQPWSTNGNIIYSPSNSLIGIRTPNPQSALDVQGTFGLWGSGLNGDTYQRTVIYSDATYGLLIEAPKIGTTKSDINISWRGQTQSPFTISGSNQYIGIGKAHPETPLHIYGSHVAAKGILLAESPDHAIIATSAASNYYQSGFRIMSQNAIMWDIMQNEDGLGNNLSINNGTKRLMSFSRSTGNIGINDDNPSQTFSIKSNGGASTYIKIDKPNSGVEAGVVFSKSNANEFYFYSDDAENALKIQTANDNGDLTPRIMIPGDNLNLYACLSGGNFAIGKKSANAKLDVAGDAVVSGNINAGSITTRTWSVVPDYVFEKGYKLKPLAEVEKFVDQNKHLPEIPSAREIEINGLNLAEMNMKLLKKVEELTLVTSRTLAA